MALLHSAFRPDTDIDPKTEIINGSIINGSVLKIENSSMPKNARVLKYN